jgi:hypothetical protein
MPAMTSVPHAFLPGEPVTILDINETGVVDCVEDDPAGTGPPTVIVLLDGRCGWAKTHPLHLQSKLRVH